MKLQVNLTTIHSADIVFASRLGMTPALPWIRPGGSILHNGCYLPDKRASDLRLAIGTGFDGLSFINADLREVLTWSADVTVALDHYQQRRPKPPVLTDLVHCANETQHKLLNIPPKPSSGSDWINPLQNMCRLAALIYSDMVIFPLPATTGTKPRLAGELHFAIDLFEFSAPEMLTLESVDCGVKGHFNFMLWILMLGCIAAKATPNSDWYAQKLGRYISRTPHIKTWPEFSNLMSTFLWWDYIFDDPGAKLWWEARRTLPGNDLAIITPTEVTHDTLTE